jgi:hypothetical protein
VKRKPKIGDLVLWPRCGDVGLVVACQGLALKVCWCTPDSLSWSWLRRGDLEVLSRA